MSTTDDLSESEIDRRYNHWDDNDMSRCKDCGSFIAEPEIENGAARYFCKACDTFKLDYRG